VAGSAVRVKVVRMAQLCRKWVLPFRQRRPYIPDPKHRSQQARVNTGLSFSVMLEVTKSQKKVAERPSLGCVNLTASLPGMRPVASEWFLWPNPRPFR
jgi:hypothetical protein